VAARWSGSVFGTAGSQQCQQGGAGQLTGEKVGLAHWSRVLKESMDKLASILSSPGQLCFALGLSWRRETHQGCRLAVIDSLFRPIRHQQYLAKRRRELRRDGSDGLVTVELCRDFLLRFMGVPAHHQGHATFAQQLLYLGRGRPLPAQQRQYGAVLAR